MYPNPVVGGIAYIDLQSIDIQAEIIEFYNTLGLPVLSLPLTGSSQVVEVPMHTLRPGTYTWVLHDCQGLLYSGRVMVF
jgi:hypothetical protein